MSLNKRPDQILRRADPSTIQDKFMVGYQGWFTCANDGEPVGPGHHGWLHWITYPLTERGSRPNIDLWPDVSEYSPSELYPVVGLKLKNGETPCVFSSRHPKTVQRHFHWMALHGVDGAFLQRFAGQTDMERGNEGIRRIRDEVGDRVQEAAEREGRVYAICYDVSGVPPNDIERVIKQDWIYLIRTKAILDSPNYLREKGRAVVALWGFGFNGSGHCPHVMRGIIHFIRQNTPGGAYIMAGCPAYWRTASDDADRNPEFLDVWLNEFDAISPWTVGRYGNEAEADNFSNTRARGDVELLNRRAQEGHKKVDYIPVVLPGGSGFNLSEGKWKFNDMKRNGGKFLWTQIYNAKRLGVRTIYGAMWDEYDEGTALMPAVSKSRNLPQSDHWPFLALDEDGYDLPSDWFMRICGFAAEGLRGERRVFDTFPVKELHDYWSTRPKYESVNLKGEDFISGSTSGVGVDGDGQTYQDWLATQKEDKDEPPPPPYSLEAAEAEPQPIASPPRAQSQSQSTQPVSGPSAEVQHITPVGVPHAPPVPITTRPLTNEPVRIPSTSTRPVSPPVVNATSRPKVNSPSNSLSSLTEDFRRHEISSPPMPTYVPQELPQPSPPPAHPSRPGSALPYSPYIPSKGQNMFEQSYFSAQQSQYPLHHTSSYSPGTPAPLPPRPGPSSRPQTTPPQWPPAEWNTAPKPQSPGVLDANQRPHTAFPQPYGGLPPHEATGAGNVHPVSPGISPGRADSPPTFPQAFVPYLNQSNYAPYSPPNKVSPPLSPRPHSPGMPASHMVPPPATGRPPMPPRPSNSTGTPYGSSLGGAAMGYAFSAIDKVAGKQTREQLESKVSSLTNTGTKLFGKFTK